VAVDSGWRLTLMRWGELERNRGVVGACDTGSLALALQNSARAASASCKTHGLLTPKMRMRASIESPKIRPRVRADSQSRLLPLLC